MSASEGPRSKRSRSESSQSKLPAYSDVKSLAKFTLWASQKQFELKLGWHGGRAQPVNRGDLQYAKLPAWKDGELEDLMPQPSEALANCLSGIGGAAALSSYWLLNRPGHEKWKYAAMCALLHELGKLQVRQQCEMLVSHGAWCMDLSAYC